MDNLLPSTYIPPNRINPKLFRSDLIDIKPLGPPSNIFYYMDYIYDNTKWKLEQRLKKIDQIVVKIKKGE